MTTFDEVIASARPQETAVTICVAGDLAGEHEVLTQQLAALNRAPVTSIAGRPEALALAEQIRDLEERMREHEHTFRFRALPRKEYSDLTAAHEPRPGRDERLNTDTFPPALIAACAVEPAMTLDQVERLSAVLSDAGFDALFDAAWRANRQGPSVPFSRAASAILQSTEQN